MPQILREFTVDIDGKGNEVGLAFIKPSTKDNDEAQIQYSQRFTKALNEGACFAESIQQKMIEQGLWSVKEEERFLEIFNEIADLEEKLEEGGIELGGPRPQTKWEPDSVAWDCAVRMRQLRFEMQQLNMKRNRHADKTAEGLAESHRFNFLLTRCLVYNEGDKEGERVFPNVAAYEAADPLDWHFEAAKQFAELNHGLDQNYEEQYPENKFLKDFGFVDDKYQLVDSDGDLIDINGQKLDTESLKRVFEENDAEKTEKKERKPFLRNGEPVSPKTE